jgi:hypothetical protein
VGKGKEDGVWTNWWENIARNTYITYIIYMCAHEARMRLGGEENPVRQQ